MAKKLNNALSADPADRHTFIAIDAVPRATLKDLRKSASLTQADLAVALAVGQDAVSRLEKRSDMLLSSLRQYVESVGGQLTLVATFPDQPPAIIDPFGAKNRKKTAKKRSRKQAAAGHGEP